MREVPQAGLLATPSSPGPPQTVCESLAVRCPLGNKLPWPGFFPVILDFGGEPNAVL